MKDKEFWLGKKVLITGHTGFKGSWLSIWLTLLGAKVVGFSLEDVESPSIFKKAKLDEKLIDIRGDIRNLTKLKNVFGEHNPEIVFHLAAQPLVRESYINPVYTYEVNVNGTMNVLECIRDSKNPITAVLITTDKCYENKETIWGYRENDAFGGYDPYSSSKACCEVLISSWRNSFFNPKEYMKHNKSIASARAGNVIGGGDFSKDRIIPDFIRALEANLLFLGTTKAKVRLNWEGKLNIDETLVLTGDWYKRYKNEDVFSLCNEQIKYYMEIVEDKI